MVLTVQENEDGQAATVSGAINTSVIENIELHATVDTDTVTDYMEEIKDEDLDLSQSKPLCNEVLCARKLTKVFFWLCSELLLDLARTHGNYAKGLQQSGNDNICINITKTS